MRRSSLIRAKAQPLAPNAAGFSLLELMMVLAIMLTIGALATPFVTTTMDAYRTRGGLTNIAGLVQRCRVLAIRNNTSERILFGVNGAGQVQVYCKTLANQGAALLPTDPQITLIPQFSAPGLPAGPPPLTPLAMWGANFAQVGTDTDPYFNSRGLPCSAPAAGAACTTISGYVYYFRYRSSNIRWGAVTISPAARVQTWYWNGNQWGN